MKHDWEYKRLGEVATYVNGYAFKPQQWTNSGLPIIRIQNLNNPDASYNCYDGEISEQYNVVNGDLLISWSASLGTYIWNGGNALLNQHIFKVVFDKLDINKFYLKYAVSSKLEAMGRLVHGATMKHIVKKDFDNMRIPVPPIKEQEEICSLLDKLRLAIEKKKAQLKQLDNLAQSIFYDMFGDPVENEKGWEVKKMGNVAPAVEYKGKHPQIANKYWLLNLDKVEAQTGRILSIDYYDYEEIGNSVVSFDKTNVLYSKLRPYLNKVVVPMQIGYATSELVPLQPNASLLDRQYIAYMLRSKLFVDYISGKVAGAKMPRVTMSVFRDFKVPIPHLSLQQSFAQKVEAIERQKELINQSIREAQTLFDSRMEYYFGE